MRQPDRLKQNPIDTYLRRHEARPVVVVQGLGFVGSAMLTALANAAGRDSRAAYRVIGVDRDAEKVLSINRGKLPVSSSDRILGAAFKNAFSRDRIFATTDPCAFACADILVVDINLDVRKNGRAEKDAVASLTPFLQSMRQLARLIKPSCLVLIESTVPPGTCQKLLLPLLQKEFTRRRLNPDQVLLAHSYERVMPGKDYLKSITSFFRVYSGVNTESKRRCRRFLESFIDTQTFPLTCLETTTASEMAKVLENSFRAANIALIQEWTEFAQKAEVNLFEVVEAIRRRETHKNIMAPGFGVGGYCLTKDPLLADWSRKRLCGSNAPLTMSVESVRINDRMPLYSFRLLKENLKRLRGKHLLLLGVSYRKEIGDTRFSPSELFYRACRASGARVTACDPFVAFWPEAGIRVWRNLSALKGTFADALIFAVNHPHYESLSAAAISRFLKPRALVLDCCNCVDERTAAALTRQGYTVRGVGKGHWEQNRTHRWAKIRSS